MTFAPPDLAICAVPWPLHPTWPEIERDGGTIAVHEAAHLVAHLALALPAARLVASLDAETRTGAVRRYTAEGDLWGKADGPPPEEAFTPDPIEPPAPALQQAALRMATMYAAGYAAEALLHGFAEAMTGFPAPLHRTPDGRGVDVYTSFAWPTVFGGPHWCAWRLALHVLSAEWGWVMRVAERIETAGQCDDAEALALRCVASH